MTQTSINMNHHIAALFDMDGVMIDTEPQYSVFWNKIAKEHNIGIPNFEYVIKGTTLPNILSKYFSGYTQDQLDILTQQIDDLEAELHYPEIIGAISFVEELKQNGVKVGLVTSSLDKKMASVNKELNFDKLFDTVVTGSHITKGKPAPDCYLLAAQHLGVAAKNCIVFEDAFTGIEAGNRAGMQVVGLATTHTANMLKNCVATIPNFKNFTFENLLSLLK